MTHYLTLEDLLALAEGLAVGPVRDLGLLDSAAHRPTTTLWGQDAYPSLDDKAAALLQSVVRNQALVDGNRRLGWLSAVVFYAINGETLVAPDDDAYDLVIAIASGQVEQPHVAATLRKWH